ALAFAARLAVVAGAAVQTQNGGGPRIADQRFLAAAVTPVLDDLWQRFDHARAQQHVEFVSQYWRLAGNEGYDKSIDRIQARLTETGFGAQPSATTAHQHVETYAANGRDWDHSIGTLALVHPGGT